MAQQLLPLNSLAEFFQEIGGNAALYPAEMSPVADSLIKAMQDALNSMVERLRKGSEEDAGADHNPTAELLKKILLSLAETTCEVIVNQPAKGLWLDLVKQYINRVYASEVHPDF